MKKSVREYEDLVLQKGKVVTVKPIRRKRVSGLAKDGEDIFTGCSKSITLRYDPSRRSYTSPFTSNQESDEQEAFEYLLHQEEGALNLYNFNVTKPNFWGNFLIKIPKEGTTLDLGTPNGSLMYKILCVDPKVATDSSETSIAEKVFQIFDDSKEKQVISLLAKKKSKAYKYISEATKNKKVLIETLKLLGKKPTPDSSKEWLEAELYKVTDQVETTRGMSGLDKFIEVMEDNTRDVKLFVIEAIDQQEIIRDVNGFKIADTKQFVGRKYDEVVQYFLDKDPAVQETKLIIQDRIK